MRSHPESNDHSKVEQKRATIFRWSINASCGPNYFHVSPLYEASDGKIPEQMPITVSAAQSCPVFYSATAGVGGVSELKRTEMCDVCTAF